jgi:uncharacterized protein (TIGR03437 family)
LLLPTAGLLAVHAAAPGLSLTISSETAPAGAWAQFKVTLAAPHQVTAGYLSMDFDPAVFGSIGNLAVFSATGDAAGFAHVTGTHVDATFTSPSGGIGQLPGLPVLVVSVPVLPGVASGKTTTVTADPTGAPWNNPAGTAYAVTATPATFQVGGTISIQSISPSGGLVPSGTVIAIQGTGFDSATTATMDGVNLPSVQYVSAQQMNVTLGTTTELTGKHLHLANSSGEQIDYFAALPSTPGDGSAPSTVAPIVPLTTFQTVQWPNPMSDHVNEYAWLLNPTSAPVTVTFFDPRFDPCFSSSLQTITILPGELNFFPGLGHTVLWMVASAPIRLLEYTSTFEGTFEPNEESVAPPIPVAALPSSVLPPIAENWQTGTPPPVDVLLSPSCSGTAFAASSATPQWLSVTEGPNTAPRLSFDVTSLAAGTYTGTVTETTPLPAALAALPAPQETQQVVLNVSASPFLTASSPNVQWNVPAGGSAQSPQVITVQSSGAAIRFTAAASTTSGGNWLSVTPAQGTTPATLTVNANPGEFAAYGTYQGQVTIQGPANTVTLPAAVYAGALAIPSPVSFLLEAGSVTPSTQLVVSEQETISAVSVQTQLGGNWLSAVVSGGTGVEITVTAANLRPGIYQGTATFATPAGSIVNPVTLTVLGPPAGGLTVAPSSISLTAPAGQSVTQTISVNSASTPALISYTSSIGYVVPASSGMTVGSLAPSVTPAALQLTVSANQPGTYSGSVFITWDGGSATIPVTFSATATPGLPPMVSAVVSAASETAGAIAPGEMVSIFGLGVGPAPTGLTLDASGKVARQLGNAQVVIDGVPAPLVYASASQVNAIVPYETGSGGIATLQVISNGAPSAIWQLPVAAAAPALFTAGSTGVGQAAVLNQNNSVNSASNPAARGETIQIFATGGGQTSPASATGSVAGNPGATTLLPVTVTVGGMAAQVTYRGSAPGEIAGLLQIDAVVPAEVTPGPAVPIVIAAGGVTSQGGVSIAVK